LKRKYGTGNKIILTVLCLAITFLLAQFSLAQDPARKPRPKTGFNPFQMDSRAKELTYHFKDTDEDMKYLMGHSMGGAGTLYLGAKYGSIWAAIAPIAPAAFGIEPDSLEKIKDMPVIFVHGAADEVVPVNVSQRWVAKAKELNMTYEYNDMEGISHGPVITAALPSVYEFFAKHSKSK
jgi:predicted esterase